MKCTYCPQSSHVANYKAKTSNRNDFVLSFDNFTNFISTVPTSVDIVFAGMAEPFMNKDCTRMIQHAQQKGHIISIYTTCYGMTLADVEALKHIPTNHLCLHLPDANGWMNLKVTPAYLEVLKACLPISKNLMCIGQLHPEVEAITGPVPSGEHGLYSRGGSITHLAIPRKTGKLQCQACGPDLNHNILMPNGDVLLCCMDYNQKHVIGNLNQHTYADLFHTDEYKKVKQGMLDESIDILCRRCEVSSKA